MHEQRLTVRLLKHWNMLRKEEHMPMQQQFTIEAVSDLWPNCFMVSVDMRGAKHQYKYEYIGEAIIKAYGSDLTHKMVDQNVKQFPGVIMYKKLGEVLSEHRPTEDSGFFVSESGKLVKYRACFLPLGSQLSGVSHIVVGLSFRQF